MYLSTKVFSSIVLAGLAFTGTAVAQDENANPALTDLASAANGVCSFSKTSLPPITRTEVVLETDMATVVQCEVTETTTSTVCETTTVCENTPTADPVIGEPTCDDDKAEATADAGAAEPYSDAGAEPMGYGDEPMITPAARRFRA